MSDIARVALFWKPVYTNCHEGLNDGTFSLFCDALYELGRWECELMPVRL